MNGASSCSFAGRRFERVDQGVALALRNRGNRVERPVTDREREGGAMKRPHDPANIGRAITPEQHQKPALLIAPAMIELDQDAVGFSILEIIIMKADRLALKKLVSGYFTEFDVPRDDWSKHGPGEVLDECRR